MQMALESVYDPYGNYINNISMLKYEDILLKDNLHDCVSVLYLCDVDVPVGGP